MANIKAAAIQTRLNEVLFEAYGAGRTIAAGTYGDDAPDGLDAVADQRRAMDTPIIRVRLVSLARSQASPPVLGNFLIYDGRMEFELTRLISTEEQLDVDVKTALDAASMKDADVLRQALEYPGNLTTTAAGTATDIASGMLVHEMSEWRVDGKVNDGAQRFVSTHRFTGKFFARPA